MVFGKYGVSQIPFCSFFCIFLVFGLLVVSSSQESSYSTRFYVLFLPDEWTKHISTLIVLAALITTDLYFIRKGTMAKPHNNVDYTAHLSGSMAGIAAGLYLNKGLGLKKRKPVSKDKKKVPSWLFSQSVERNQ